MSGRKPPRRTRERILEASLALFNARGEPHVTTGDIALELNISPGNLYYHFRNKEAITCELFAGFTRALEPLLPEVAPKAHHVEDLWLWVHLLLERMVDHRFLYRDLVDIAARHEAVRSGLARLLVSGERTLCSMLEGLRSAGVLRATAAEIGMLGRIGMMIVTHATAYERLRRIPTRNRDPDGWNLDRAASDVLMLIAPHLAGQNRALVERLSRDYTLHR